MNNKRVLLISYHFPPDSEVGAIRPAKFVKYLPEFGWIPYTLTIKEKYIKIKSYDRLKDVEESKIFRVAVWPNLMEIILKIRNLIFFRTDNKNIIKSSKISSNHQLFEDNSTQGFIFLLKRILNSTLELPDKMIGWLIPAVWKGYWLIRKEKIEVIITTSPPQTVSVVGLILSKLTNVKLITDYRDPWPFQSGTKHIIHRTRLSDIIEKWLEREVACESNRIITTTEHYAKLLRSSHSDMSVSKFCTIYNGFDSSDYRFSDLFTTNNDMFIITYLGRFCHGRTPNEFLEALSLLRKDDIINFNKMRVNFIGNVNYSEGIPTKDLVNKYNLSRYVNISDNIPYKESLAQMERAVVLLLFAPEQYYMIPAKAFEYIYAKRYILCFTKKGATADLIKRTKSGIVVDPYNVAQIKEAIKTLYIRWKSREKICYIPDIAFERRGLTHKLSQLLEEIM